jgi:hypothetical protein
MTFMSSVKIGVLATVLLGAAPVFSANIPCRNCTEIGYAQRAVGAGRGQHYVFDYQRGSLRRYNVQCGGPSAAAQKPGEKEGPSLQSTIEAAACGPSQTLRAEQIENEAFIQQGFLELKAFWDATGGTMKSLINVDFGDLAFPTVPGDTPSAFDILNNYNYQVGVGQHIANDTYALYRLSFLSSMANAFVGFTDGARIVIRVTFPDGTKANYELVYPNPIARYMPETALLPDGQAIPEANAARYAGTWNATGWTGRQRNDWIAYMASIGVPVTRGNGIIRCTWNGHELRC